jgi:hypothetical protein
VIKPLIILALCTAAVAVTVFAMTATARRHEITRHSIIAGLCAVAVALALLVTMEG